MADSLTGIACTPIAQLTPFLSAPSTRSIKAVVALIWPYSSSNLSLTVLLAEPDFRLRRNRGQVRVQFSGSIAKTVFEAGIGIGDEVILSLDGAEWIKDESVTQSLRRSVEWELKYTERLLLQIQENETKKISLLDIDHPSPRQEPEPEQRIESPEAVLSPPKSVAPPHSRPRLTRSETSEWDSPAFVKRARVSYGSLLESGHDMFADDGTVHGKGRKRTRFSRDSGSWRYSSRSLSPEVEKADDGMAEDSSLGLEERKPLMADEGCQTLDFDDNNVAEALTNSSRQAVAARDREILSQDDLSPPLGTEDVIASEVVGNRDESKAPVNMQPPLIPQLILDIRAQEDIESQEVIADDEAITPISPRLHPVLSDALPLVSPLVSSAPSAFHGHPHDNSATMDGKQNYEHAERHAEEIIPHLDVDMAEDLHSPSPESLDQTHKESLLEAIAPFMRSHEGPQTLPDVNHLDSANQYGHWQSAMAAQKQLSRSNSPLKAMSTGEEAYPEPDMDGEHSGHVQVGPYYGHDQRWSPSREATHDFQGYPDLDGDLVHQHLENSLEVGTTECHPQDPAQMSEREDSHDVSVHELIKTHNSPAGLAMTPSQSAQSEIVDLTEESYAEAEEANETADNMEIDHESESDDLHYGESRIEHGWEEDEEDSANDGDHSYDGEELAKDQFDDDGEDRIKSPPGFRLANHNLHLGPAEDDEEMDEGEEEEYYEEEKEEYYEEDLSDEGAAAAATNQLLRAEPEVIDLLSSDDEDAEDDASVDLLDATEDPEATMIGEYSDDEAESDRDADDLRAEDEEIEDHERHEPAHEGIGREEIEPQVEELMTSEVNTEKFEELNRDVFEREDGGLEEKEAGDKDSGDETPSHQLREANELSRVTKYAELVYEPSSSDDEIENAVEPAASAGKEIETPISAATVSFLGQEKLAVEDDHVRMSKNGQLPTPDATQSLSVIAPDVSFTSLVTNQPLPADEQHANKIVDDAQQAPEQDAVKAIESNGASTGVKETVELPPSTPRGPMQTSSGGRLSARTDRSSSVVVDNLTTPHFYDASAELAIVALDSPTKQDQNEQPISDTTLRLPVQTSHGEFTPLKQIRFNLGKKLDVLAIATANSPETQRAKNGPRHYHLRFNVTDPSTSNAVTEIQVFRPHKDALPIVKAGDGVLLRHFLVKAEARAGFALKSDDASSWVVFKSDGETEMRGPPVEFGDGETEHIEKLKTWYRNLDKRSRERLDKANWDKGSHGAKGMGKVF